MTDLLKKAFEEASRLPDAAQDALARVLLVDLRSERSWDGAFRMSEHARLGQLAAEARREYYSGTTGRLDNDDLCIHTLRAAFAARTPHRSAAQGCDAGSSDSREAG